jgi:hypothetical protein
MGGLKMDPYPARIRYLGIADLGPNILIDLDLNKGKNHKNKLFGIFFFTKTLFLVLRKHALFKI